MNVVENIRNLISENKTKEALEKLINFSIDKDLSIYNECLLHSAKLKKVSMDFRLGLIDYANFLPLLNQINFAILALLKDIEKPYVSLNDSTRSLTNGSSNFTNDSFNIFLSYSQNDIDLVKNLDTHLAVLKKNRNAQTWFDQKILPGQNWLDEIKKAIQKSNLIIFLVSPDFLASDFCKLEIKWAMEKQKKDNIFVIPVILKPCLWEETSLSKFQSLPVNRKPVILWENLDEALTEIAEAVRNVVIRNQNKVNER